MNGQKTRNSFLLFMAACIWGMAFVSQSKGMDYMGPFTFNGARSVIGALALLCYLAVRRLFTDTKNVNNQQTDNKIDWKRSCKAGVLCGLVMAVASNLQQFGIQYTTVGKAGFITTLYIIFVPIAGLFFKKAVAGVVWVAAAMAAVGMYLLCMTESLSINSGDILVFLCAIAFTVHILVIDHFAENTDGALISCIQFAVSGVLSCIAALIWEKPELVQLSDGMGTLLYAGVLSCGVAYTLQIVGQKGVNPTIAALILSLESVVATIAGWVAFRIGFLQNDQTLTTRQILGCVIVFAAVILVQLPAEWFSRKKENET